MPKKVATTNGFMPVTPETYGMEKPSKPKVHKYYPSFTIPLKDIPAAKDWEVGEEYEVSLVVRQTAMRKDANSSSVSFEILKIKPE